MSRLQPLAGGGVDVLGVGAVREADLYRVAEAVVGDASDAPALVPDEGPLFVVPELHLALVAGLVHAAVLRYHACI